VAWLQVIRVGQGRTDRDCEARLYWWGQPGLWACWTV